jgi:sister-chromatid-cohesion protein PDS5
VGLLNVVLSSFAQSVFDLFIEHIKSIKRVNGPHYNAVVELLQSLCSVKAFILLAFVDMNTTTQVFKLLFECVQREHFESRVAESMLEIMCDVVCELEEIPEPLLYAVFQCILPPNKEDKPEAYQLAKVREQLLYCLFVVVVFVLSY